MDKHDAFRREQWRRDMRSPSRWLDVARALMDNARELGREFPSIHERNLQNVRMSAGEIRLFDNRLPTYKMLCAFAVENYLKSILILRGADPVTPSGHVAKDFKSHDLERMAARCGISTLNPDELFFVRTLSLFLTWGGRYPGPLCENDVTSQTHHDGRRIIRGTEERSFGDYHRVEALVCKLEKEFQMAQTEAAVRKLSPPAGGPNPT